MDALQVEIVIMSALELPATDGSSCDPYVKFVYKENIYKTEYKKKTLKPCWDEKFIIIYDQKFGPHTIRFEVWDANMIMKDKKVGEVSVNLQTLQMNAPCDKWYPLEKVAKAKDGAAIRIKLTLLPSILDTFTAESQVGTVANTPGYDNTQQWQQWERQQQWYQTQLQQTQQWQQWQNQQQQWPTQQQWSTQQQQPYYQGYPYPQPAHAYDPSQWNAAHQQAQEESTSSSSSSSDEEKKKKKKKKEKKKVKDNRVDASPELMLQIKEVLPQCNYKQIAKALRKHDNDKEEALKELVLVAAGEHDKEKEEK